MICPLCNIPNNEHLLYEDNNLYLVNTKYKKGHDHRVMIVLKEHRKYPTFKEISLAYSILLDYMTKLLLPNEPWLIVGMSKHTAYPDHWHLIASDNRSIDPIEKEKLLETPVIRLPIKIKYSNIIFLNKNT